MNQPSVYQRAARDGLFMGIYLIAMWLFAATSPVNFDGAQVPLWQVAASAIGSIMLLGVPVVAYVLMFRSYRASNRSYTFWALWLEGIYMFLCASLLLAAATYLFTRFAQPDFITRQVSNVIQIYQSLDTPETREMARTLQQMVDQHLLPTPISFALSLLWAGAFSGSILTLILTPIIRLIHKQKK